MNFTVSEISNSGVFTGQSGIEILVGNLQTGLTKRIPFHSGNTALNGTFTYSYDTTYAHRLSSVTNGTLTQSYGYDSSGNVNSTTLSNGSGRILNSYATFTGSKNRIFYISDASGNSIKYLYSAGNSSMWGLPTSITDGNDVTVTQAYDKFGRLTNTTLANTASLVYNYSNGNLTSVTRTDTPNSSQQTYTMGYDGFGNMTLIRVGSRNLATYTYGPRNGLMDTMTMANGEVFTYEHDFLGRQTEQLNSSGTGLGTFYTADGQISTNTEVGYEYPLSWRYTYDSLGRQIASVVSIPGGTFLQTQQSYNDKNQLTSKNWKMWEQNYGETYTYNEDGSLNTVSTASGANLQYHYDHLRRVSSITSDLWGTMDFYTKTYSYRNISSTQTTPQVSSVAYSNIVSPIAFGYTYDAVGNIASYSQNEGNTVTYTYTYDSQGQLLKAVGPTTYTYTYDNVGNILTASNGTTTHTYTYGNSDWKDLLTKFDGVTITYDASGNPLAYYNGTSWNFTWAAGRRLMSAVSGSNTINFSYNEDGSRASKTVNGTRHNYTWDGQTLVRDYYGNTILDFSYDANGQPYAMHYNSTPYFYILNLQGDVIRMVDGNGNTVASYEYDPYGRVISATGSMAEINPLRYRGYYYDQETKLYHLWSRYYDPQTGRFINADEFSSTGQGPLGHNMFTYCLNNPINRTDIDGTASLWWYLIVDHDMGFIHRAVEAYILANYPGTSQEYVIKGFGRADIVRGSAVWEIKHAGTNILGRIIQAHAQASLYVEFSADLNCLGNAGEFSGSFTIVCLSSTYLVEYTTPAAGVILYTVSEISSSSAEPEFEYVPQKVKEKEVDNGAVPVLPAIGFLGIGFSGGGKYSSLPGTFSQFI